MPDYATVEDLTISIADLCTFGWRRLLMTGVLRHELTRHFSSAATIENPLLRSRLWTADDTSNILIEDVLTWTPTRAQKRHGVLIVAGPLRSERVILGNRALSTADGKTIYTKKVTGSHTINCIAVEGPEVEILAAEVYRFLEHFGPELRRILTLLRFDVTEIGPPAPIEEFNDMLVVPVGIEYGWDDTWAITPQTSTLEGITLAALINGTNP